MQVFAGDHGRRPTTQHHDTAFVDHLFGQVSSTAMAGLGNNFDLAGAVGDNLSADAFGADFLAHILPFF